MQLLLWICIFLFIYPYVIYPFVLEVFKCFVKSDHKSDSFYEPNVSFLVSAYNEENVIEDKLKNILEIDYPKDKYEILVGCDGCTDKTANKIKNFIKYHNEMKISLYNFKKRRGKISVINDLAKNGSSNILILSDANSIMNKGAVRELIKYFYDNSVGIVAGAKKVIDNQCNNTSIKEGFYWRYENKLKTLETEIYSTIIADGSIYAIKKELYPFPKENIVTDDLFISLNIIENGKKIIYNPNAFIIENCESNVRLEYRRKKRIASGCFQLMWEIIKDVFVKFDGIISFMFISHKILRWIGFIWMAAIFTCNLTLINNSFYLTIFFMQLLIYFLVILQYFLERKGIKLKGISFIYYFVITNVAQLHGMILCISKKQSVLWEKSNR